MNRWSCSTNSLVRDIARITAGVLKSIHQRSVFTVVTDNCHSNTVLVSRVTEVFKRFLSTFSIGIDDVRATWSPRVGVFDITAGSTSWKTKRHRKTTISQKIIPVLTGKEKWWRKKPFERLYTFISQKFYFHGKWRKKNRPCKVELSLPFILENCWRTLYTYTEAVA